jgi:putative polyhydroxyalkanoate system protein
MPKIDISRAHGRSSIQEVRGLVQLLADKLTAKYDLTCQWKGDNLEFKRKGADGYIKIDDRYVRLVMNISMLLMPIKGEIEKRTRKYMDEILG